MSKMAVLIAVDAKGQGVSQFRFAWKSPPYIVTNYVSKR